MNKKINRIVAYGCSYTAGDEIMDHIVMGITFEECNQWKRPYLNKGSASVAYTSKFKTDFNIQWDDPLHRANSWAAQVAKLADLPFENRAMNGSGLDEQYIKIYNDYENGLILDSDLVLVGLTSMDRMIDFRLKEKITTLISRNIPNDISSRLLLELYNDDYIVYHYFKTLSLLNSLNSKINLLMQPMVNNMLEMELDKLNLQHSRQYADSIWRECRPNILSEFYLRTSPKCEFGHPALECHIELAEKIHENIKLYL
jgi:hypothetical protein